MQYFISFLEGAITFVSPCLLPMLPVYLSYFAAGEDGEKGALKGAAGFSLGFSGLFITLGLLAGMAGELLSRWQRWLDVICGIAVILLGLSFMGLFEIPALKGIKSAPGKGFWAAFAFGLIFAVSWSPCVGVFLGSALALAAQQGSFVKGGLMLGAYSLGLSIPFILSALLIDRLKGTLSFIKRNYRVINTVAGGFLIITGLFMASGQLNRLLAYLSL